MRRGGTLCAGAIDACPATQFTPRHRGGCGQDTFATHEGSIARAGPRGIIDDAYVGRMATGRRNRDRKIERQLICTKSRDEVHCWIGVCREAEFHLRLFDARPRRQAKLTVEVADTIAVVGEQML
jgi:hypothetical protein